MNQVRFERHGPVAILILENAPVNCITTAMFRQIGEHIERIDADPELRAVVIQGAGKNHYTAGTDIREMAMCGVHLEGEERAAYVRNWLKGVQQVLAMIERSPKLFVCAMKGISYGGGLEMAAACDIRVAAADARFAMPEVKIGLMPGYGGTQRLARLIGKGRAMHFILAAEPVDATEAHRIGLVDLVTSPGMAEPTALELATKMTGHAPLALAGVKKAIHEGAHLDLESACELEAELFTQVSVSER